MKKILILTVVLLAASCLIFPAAAEDQITGTWHGSASIWFLASGSGSLTFNDDNTASAIGSVKILGKTNVYSFPHLTWEKLTDKQYIGFYGDKMLPFTYNGKTITASFNPYQLGATPIPLFDVDIPVKLTRS